MGTGAGGRQVSVMGGATTPSAARGGRGKMRPVAHTPGQLAAAAAFVQAWQAPTPAPVADEAHLGATGSTASFDDQRGATAASSSVSFLDERGTPSGRCTGR